jgi:hypothetical protein
MNLPGWNWKENILKPNAVFTNLHNYFMDIINSNALSQLYRFLSGSFWPIQFRSRCLILEHAHCCIHSLCLFVLAYFSM